MPEFIALGYARVSTAMQADRGASLDHQRTAIRGEAERRGWTLERIHRDVQSGKRADREGLTAALDRLDAGKAGALIVSRLDRLSRDPIFVYDVMDRSNRQGWALVIMDPAIDTSSPFGRAMAGMAAVFAQLERELLGARIREGIAQAKADGTYRGGNRLPQCAPVDPASVELIMRHADAGRSSREITRILDALGVPAPRGPAWNDRTVRRVIRARRDARAA